MSKNIFEQIRKISPQLSNKPIVKIAHQPEGIGFGKCFDNVENKVDRDGGEICYGWNFTLEKGCPHGLYLKAIHHAVWRSGQKELIDVTPYRDHQIPCGVSGKLLFLPDPKATQIEDFLVLEDGANACFVTPRPSRFFPLKNDKLLKIYIEKLTLEEQRKLAEMRKGHIEKEDVMSFHQIRAS